MASDFLIPTVNDTFFLPLLSVAEGSKHTRPCPTLSDEQWVSFGIHRVLEDVHSGRAFLQEHGPRFECSAKVSNYFASLQSPRRAAVLQDVAHAVLRSVAASGVDRLAHIPELASYVCFAVDLHWHRAATHDERFDGTTAAVGHCFSLNLHDHGIRHWGAAEGEHEHDMSVLKRLKPDGLRQAVPKGTRVVLVYDRAGVDLVFWKRCRQEKAVYFLSRAKLNMIFEWENEMPWDPDDARNNGVHFDQWVLSRDGHRMRLIEYVDPPNRLVAAELEVRWNAALTHAAEAEDKRRAQRQHSLSRVAAAAGRAVSTLLLGAREATQRSAKFVRWLRQSLRDRVAEGVALARLSTLFATQ